MLGKSCINLVTDKFLVTQCLHGVLIEHIDWVFLVIIINERVRVRLCKNWVNCGINKNAQILMWIELNWVKISSEV